MGKMAILSALIAALFMVDPAFSQYAKCTDARGKVTYSDVGCTPGTKGQAIQLKENTVDSTGDQKLLDKLDAIEDARAGIVHAETESGSTGISGGRQNSSVTQLFGHGASYSSSSSSIPCSADYRCRLEKTRARRWAATRGDDGSSGHDSPKSNSKGATSVLSHESSSESQSDDSSTAKKSRKWKRNE